LLNVPEAGHVQCFSDAVVSLRGQVNAGFGNLPPTDAAGVARRDQRGQRGDASAGSEVAGCAPGVSDQFAHPPDQCKFHARGARAGEGHARVAVADIGQKIGQCRGIQAASGDVTHLSAGCGKDAGRVHLVTEKRQQFIHAGGSFFEREIVKAIPAVVLDISLEVREVFQKRFGILPHLLEQQVSIRRAGIESARQPFQFSEFFEHEFFLS
jgi:hypothetical protein